MVNTGNLRGGIYWARYFASNKRNPVRVWAGDSERYGSGKDFYISNTDINTGSRIPGFYVQCEVGASETKPACRGSVRINLVSWLLTRNGQQIDVRYIRADGRDMRLSRSLGNWPACVFLFLVGAIVVFVWVKPMWH